MRNKDIFIKNVIEGSLGYSMPEDKLKECVDAIPDELFDSFVDTLYRCADKGGEYYFESRNIVKD